MEIEILTQKVNFVTAGELIAELSQIHPDNIIIMSKDAEGNGYSPLYNLDVESGYLPDSTWSGDVRPRVITEEMKGEGWRDEDVAGENHLPCVVFWPIN